jgi:phthalate 4,5-dioxygenase
MIIRTRRRLLDAARALAQRGTTPPGVDEPDAYAQRSGGVLLAEGANWIEDTVELRRAFVEHPELDSTIGGPMVG